MLSVMINVRGFLSSDEVAAASLAAISPTEEFLPRSLRLLCPNTRNFAPESRAASTMDA